MSTAIGIDIGGTGIKMAPVDLHAGKLTASRYRQLTPDPRSPEIILTTIQKMLSEKSWPGSIGIGFPGIIKSGICGSATNMNPAWVGMDMVDFFSKGLNRDVTVCNDADAAGIAEYLYGSLDLSKYDKVLFLTLGTGIGSAVLYKGNLLPNTELGHLKWKKGILEEYASNRAREVFDLSWKKWGNRLNKALRYINHVMAPDAIILGGGVSKKFELYKDHLELDIPIVPASLKNEAGVIGAAQLTTM